MATVANKIIKDLMFMSYFVNKYHLTFFEGGFTSLRRYSHHVRFVKEIFFSCAYLNINNYKFPLLLNALFLSSIYSSFAAPDHKTFMIVYMQGVIIILFIFFVAAA